MNQIQDLATSLLDQIYTTTDLKNASFILESLAANRQFKQHAVQVATDENLSNAQKSHQLTSLFHKINIPEIHLFFSDMFDQQQFWLFDSEKFDRFDQFVKAFQLHADTVGVVYLSTAIELSNEELRDIGKFFTKVISKHVVLSHHVNSEILGGSQVRLDNYVFDYSLRAKFDRFQQKWVDSLTNTTNLLSE